MFVTFWERPLQFRSNFKEAFKLPEKLLKAGLKA